MSHRQFEITYWEDGGMRDSYPWNEIRLGETIEVFGADLEEKNVRISASNWGRKHGKKLVTRTLARAGESSDVTRVLVCYTRRRQEAS